MSLGNAACYISLDEAKAHLRLADTTFDETLSQQIPALSELCDTLTGRIYGTLGSGFEAHALVANFQLMNFKRGIQMPEWPLLTVTSITQNGTALASSRYTVYARTGFIQFTDTAGNPVDITGNLVVTCTAGYTAVPRAVALAVMRALSYIKQRADEEGMGSELIGPQQTTWRPSIDHEFVELETIILTHLADYILDVATIADGGEVV